MYNRIALYGKWPADYHSNNWRDWQHHIPLGDVRLGRELLLSLLAVRLFLLFLHRGCLLWLGGLMELHSVFGFGVVPRGGIPLLSRAPNLSQALGIGRLPIGTGGLGREFT